MYHHMQFKWYLGMEPRALYMPGEHCPVELEGPADRRAREQTLCKIAGQLCFSLNFYVCVSFCLVSASQANKGELSAAFCLN